MACDFLLARVNGSPCVGAALVETSAVSAQLGVGRRRERKDGAEICGGLISLRSKFIHLCFACFTCLAKMDTTRFQ